MCLHSHFALLPPLLLLLLLLCNSNPHYCHPWEGFVEKSLLLSFHPLSIVFIYKVIRNVYDLDD